MLDKCMVIDDSLKLACPSMINNHPRTLTTGNSSKDCYSLTRQLLFQVKEVETIHTTSSAKQMIPGKENSNMILVIVYHLISGGRCTMSTQIHQLSLNHGK